MFTFEIPALRELRKDFSNFGKGLLKESSAILQRAAMSAQALIKVRVVQKGKDVNDNLFKPYSEAYRKKKSKRAGRAVYKVDLFDKGHLMGLVGSSGSLQTENKSNSSIILFVGGGPSKYGLNHQIGNTVPKREWFGLTDKEKAVISGQVIEEYSEIIGRF